jgi:5-methyltetrahydrofolate--homocysteine methyltransferase
MAMAAGMTSAITNPLHTEVVQAVMGADVMMGNDPDCARWIAKYRDQASLDGARRNRGRRRRSA